jgi:hypothetical protein
VTERPHLADLLVRPLDRAWTLLDLSRALDRLHVVHRIESMESHGVRVHLGPREAEVVTAFPLDDLPAHLAEHEAVADLARSILGELHTPEHWRRAGTRP